MSAPAPDEMLDMLRAIREALDIPHAATIRHDETRTRILDQRAMFVTAALGPFLDHDPVSASTMIRYLRERLAQHPPTGYVTYDQAQAALAEGKTWTEAVTLPETEGTGQ